MASIFDIFSSQLNDDQLDKIAKQIGADKGQTQDAISMTLPALIEALGRQSPGNPLSPSPNQGNLGDILGKLLGGSQAAAPRSSGGGLPDIFGELLGSKQSRVSDAVSKSSGLSKEQTGSLISILGPMLSGAIGSHAQKNNLGVDDLSNMIQNDRAKIQQSPGGGMFGKMLDQDGDGDFDMNDMLKLGIGMMFKKK